LNKDNEELNETPNKNDIQMQSLVIFLLDYDVEMTPTVDIKTDTTYVTTEQHQS
jgi:hypothetical protein